MPVSRHRIYEEVSKDQENAFLGEAMAIVGAMAKPREWTRRKDRGRPGAGGVGRPIEYPWRSLVVGLLLMGYLAFGYRGHGGQPGRPPGTDGEAGFEEAPKQDHPAPGPSSPGQGVAGGPQLWGGGIRHASRSIARHPA